MSIRPSFLKDCILEHDPAWPLMLLGGDFLSGADAGRDQVGEHQGDDSSSDSGMIFMGFPGQLTWLVLCLLLKGAA